MLRFISDFVSLPSLLLDRSCQQRATSGHLDPAVPVGPSLSQSVPVCSSYFTQSKTTTAVFFFQPSTLHFSSTTKTLATACIKWAWPRTMTANQHMTGSFVTPAAHWLAGQLHQSAARALFHSRTTEALGADRSSSLKRKWRRSTADQRVAWILFYSVKRNSEFYKAKVNVSK